MNDEFESGFGTTIDTAINGKLDVEYIIKGIRLVLTCSACPEQYDAYKEDGSYFGYFRLRHGYFRVDDRDGDQVYNTSQIHGDGIFDGQDERRTELTRGVDALIAAD